MSAPWGVIQASTMAMVGGSIILQRVAMPSDIVNTVVSKDVTGMAAFPENWVQIVPYLLEAGLMLPGLRYITSSGGRIPHSILEAMPRVFPNARIFLTYGLTEAFRSTYVPPEMFKAKMGSLGRPCPNVDVFVVKSDGTLAGRGEQGELIHRGTLVTRGYWNNPEATAERFRPCPALRDLIGEEPVHYSGDLVRIDEDGYFWFVGRVDALIKCSGYRISPTEVEELVHESGLVTYAVAFGVADEALGQVVHLAVSVDGGAVDTDALMEHCRRHMPSYMVPRRIHGWDGSMPKTETGKIDRPAVIRGCSGKT